LSTQTERQRPDQRRAAAVDNAMACIEKGQQLAGHFPNPQALDRARRVVDGTTSAEDAYRELEDKYGSPRS